MHRIEGENVDTTEGKNLFKSEAPYTTQTPDWTNAIQEELMNIIDAAGLETLFSDNDTRNQLLKALKILFMPVGSIQASVLEGRGSRRNRSRSFRVLGGASRTSFAFQSGRSARTTADAAIFP